MKKILSLLNSGLAYILCGSFLSRFVALLSSILIARFVDKSEYAYLSYADNLYSYISLLTGLGLASALLVVCTPDVSDGKQYTYLKKAMVIGGLFEILSAMALCVATQIIDIPFLDARKYMWMLLLYPCITHLFNAVQAFIRVKRNNKLYAGLGAAHTIIVAVLSIALVFGLDCIGVVISRYIAVFAVLLVGGNYVFRTIKTAPLEKISGGETKKFISLGIALMFANLFSGMMPINEAFIVNNLIKDEVITANFKVAGIIPSMLPIVTSSVMVYYFPIVAAMKDYAQVKKKVRSIAFINGGIIVVLTLLGMVLTPFTIKLVYGTKYMDAISIAYPLWLMRGVNSAFRMVPMNLLAAIGKSKFNAYVSTITCIIHALLDYYFIKLWGISAVAYAAIIVYIISGTVLWIYFNKSCDKMSRH